jgi:hypothetical protein
MRWHLDIFPSAVIEIRLFESKRRKLRSLKKKEFP